MPFEGINFGLARPTVQLENPMDVAMKAQAMRAQQQQMAIQQQGIQDAQDFRTQYGMSPGMAKNVKDIQTAGYQAEHAKSLALNEHTKAVDWLATQQNKTYQSALDALDKDPNAAPAIHAAVLGKTMQNAKQIGLDTSKSDDPMNFVQTAAPFAPGEAEKWDVDAQKQWLQQKIKDTTPEAVAQKRAELALQQQKADADNWKVEKGRDGFVMVNTKTGEWKKAPEGFVPQPTAAQVSVGLQGGANGLTPEAKDLMVEKFRKTGVLDSLGQGKAGTQLRIELMNAAAQKDKEEGIVTDLAEAKKSFKTQQDAQKFFTTGKGADAMRQQETILHHAKVFQGIADALDNGNIQIANKIGNEFGLQFGSDKATNLKMAGQIFSAEVGKYLAGSMGSAEERAELAKLMPMFNSPDQFKGGLKTLSDLVEGQRRSWMRQRTAALSGKVTDETATPASGKVGTKAMLDGWMRDNPTKTRTQGKDLMKANGYSIEGL